MPPFSRNRQSRNRQTNLQNHFGNRRPPSRIGHCRRYPAFALGYDVGFIKTSTGKTEVSATVGAANIILETIRDSGKTPVLKASGGIRDFEEARKYLTLSEVIMGETWPDPDHFRIGASSLLDDLIRVIEGETDMLPQEIIRKKRDRRELTEEEIAFFVNGVTDGSIADCQVGAFTMAVLLNGFSEAETTALTLKMRNSGSVLQWPELDAPVVDKHSSGRRRRQSKPDAGADAGGRRRICADDIRTRSPDTPEEHSTNSIRSPVTKPSRTTTFSRHGQRSRLCRYRPNRQPGARRQKIYAIRDVCATVESIPLITASILSKSSRPVLTV